MRRAFPNPNPDPNPNPNPKPFLVCMALAFTNTLPQPLVRIPRQGNILGMAWTAEDKALVARVRVRARVMVMVMLRL